MRFERNEIQTPKYLIPLGKRRSIQAYLIMAAIAIFVVGATGFFGAFMVKELLDTQFGLEYRTVQTYSLALGGFGMILYIIMGLILKVPLKNTSYYKLRTIVNNEPFDPPKKGDFTKAIRARLIDLSDEWAMLMEVKPPEAEFHIPQVIVGPGGVYTIYPSNKNAARRKYPDPGPFMKKASQSLGEKVGQQVIPIILFPNKNLAATYKKKREQRTRVMHVLEIADYFKKRKKKLTDEQRVKIEKTVFDMIEGTAPGE